MVMRDFGSTAICSTPSYFLHLIEFAEEMGIDWNDLPLRAGIFGAEPWSDEMREYIEGKTGIKAYDIYGLSEIIGPGVASACSAQHGLHIFEDHFLFEIVDPVTDAPVPDGEEGELIFVINNREDRQYRSVQFAEMAADNTEAAKILVVGETVGNLSHEIVSRNPETRIETPQIPAEATPDDIAALADAKAMDPLVIVGLANIHTEDANRLRAALEKPQTEWAPTGDAEGARA